MENVSKTSGDMSCVTALRPRDWADLEHQGSDRRRRFSSSFRTAGIIVHIPASGSFEGLSASFRDVFEGP